MTLTKRMNKMKNRLRPMKSQMMKKQMSHLMTEMMA